MQSLRPRDVQAYLSSRGGSPLPANRTPLATVPQHPHDPRSSRFCSPSPVTTRRLHAPHGGQSGKPFRSSRSGQSGTRVLRNASCPENPADRRPSAPRRGGRRDPREPAAGRGPSDLVRRRDLLLSSAWTATPAPGVSPTGTSWATVAAFIKTLAWDTERGSFVATIIAPVPPPLENQTVMPFGEGPQEPTEPFSRRVTTRLMTSLHIVDEAAKAARLDPIINGIGEGISANLCDAVVAMKSRAISHLDIRIIWSRSCPQLPQGVPEVVTFAQAILELIAEASRRFSAMGAPASRAAREGPRPSGGNRVALRRRRGQDRRRTEVGGNLPASSRSP